MWQEFLNYMWPLFFFFWCTVTTKTDVSKAYDGPEAVSKTLFVSTHHGVWEYLYRFKGENKILRDSICGRCKYTSIDNILLVCGIRNLNILFQLYRSNFTNLSAHSLTKYGTQNSLFHSSKLQPASWIYNCLYNDYVHSF